MQIFRKTPDIDFLKFRKIAALISLLIIAAGVTGLLTKGMRLGIDFQGGTNVQVRFTKQTEISTIRDLLTSSLGLEAVVTNFGGEGNNEFLIAIPQDQQLSSEDYISDRINEALRSSFPQMEIRRVESVGPKVGSDLRSKALYAILLALAGILFYITIRFEFVYGIGAIIALFHDIFVIITIFVLLGKEFNLIIVASLLTILGYSLNDTIVIFDRIREKQRLMDIDIVRLVNLGVNECLSRTILTSATTLLVVLMLYFVGGDILSDFALSIIIGLVVGTYSSVFVAGSSLVFLQRFYQKKKASS
jgi:preprotein translocase subunit SecF